MQIVNYFKCIRGKDKAKNFSRRHIIFLALSISLVYGAFFCLNGRAQASSSPDAIAIRVIPNKNNYSPLKWYKDQGFAGSPQIITVDGYEAIRDGRTVYVNAANVVDTDNDGTPDTLYTNIYLISYNQDTEKATVDIFGKILKHWKFNSNIVSMSGPGICRKDNTQSDCAGTVGCWTFNGDFDDHSGNNYHGAPNGGVGFTVNGIIGEAAEFDGVDDYVDIPFVDFSNGYTIEALVNLYDYNSPDPGHKIIYEQGGFKPMLYYNTDAGNTTSYHRFVNYVYDGSDHEALSNSRFLLNTWYHVVGTWDKNTLKLYVNGALNGQAPLTSLSSSAFNGRIGGDISWGGHEWWYGLIDEFKIYDHPLSQQEILAKYNKVMRKCLTDDDCEIGSFCSSLKARITRDTIRLADLADIREKLEVYKDEHGGYPVLKAGTYLTQRTISVWPSWQDTLAKDLNDTLPVDPINKLGPCPGYDPNTCWNEATKQFAGSLPNNTPPASNVYIYTASSTGESSKVCAIMESGLINASGGHCGGNILANNPPKIVSVNLAPGMAQRKYSGYVKAIDSDGDILNWSITCSGSWAGWTPSCPLLRNTTTQNQKEVYATRAGGNGNYDISITVDDGRGGADTVTATIQISTCSDLDGDGYGNPASTACSYPDFDCDDTKDYVFPGAVETCDTHDNDCDGSIDEGCDDDADGYCDDSMRLYTNNSMCVNTTFSGNGMSGDDCDDSDANIYPGATEICDGLDNNCDGNIDETCDIDNDGYCGCSMSFAYGADLSAICPMTNTSDNYWWNTTCDCDDANSAVNPGKAEICTNGLDDDCDGYSDCLDSDCYTHSACVSCGDGSCDVAAGECSTCLADCDAATCCGNGVTDLILGEECDDGADGNDLNECYDNCTKTYCGDNITQNSPYNGDFIVEQCDDNNVIPGDGCDANCQSESLNCLDGICQAGECRICPADCSLADCCGNGSLEYSLGEQCDDNNVIPGDGCDDTCQIEPICVSAPAGMVGWWPGDGHAMDIQGANNASLQAGAAYVGGKVIQAFSLDGVGAYVDIPEGGTNNLDGFSELTIDAWIYPNSFGTDRVIVSKYDASLPNGASYSLSLDSAGRLKFTVFQTPQVFVEITSYSSLQLGKWSHVAGVWSGGSNLKLYLGGLAFAGTTSTQGTFTSMADNNTSVNIGRFVSDGSGPGGYFDGEIDEVEIYNRALSFSEVSIIKNAGTYGKCKPCIFPFVFPCSLFP
jgi:cysteine-rich repeat protein